MERLGSRERKLVAVLLVVLAFALAYFVVVAPIVQGFSDRSDQRAIATLRYARNARLIASIPKLRRVLEAQAPERRKFVLPVRTTAEAQEYLQERLRTILAEVGADLTTVEPIESSDAAATAAAISGATRLTYPQVLTVIKRVQDDQPFLLIDGLTIVANQALVTGKLDTLDMKIDISIPFSPAAQR